MAFRGRTADILEIVCAAQSDPMGFHAAWTGLLLGGLCAAG
jgi:hypothetical protein